MKIGILYICTGNYTVFWEDFYESFSKYFCTNSEIHYFVFSVHTAFKKGHWSVEKGTIGAQKRTA